MLCDPAVKMRRRFASSPVKTRPDLYRQVPYGIGPLSERLDTDLLFVIRRCQPLTGALRSDIPEQLVYSGLAAGFCVNVLDDYRRIERAVAGL